MHDELSALGLLADLFELVEAGYLEPDPSASEDEPRLLPTQAALEALGQRRLALVDSPHD